MSNLILELFPFVSDNLATAEASNRNYHFTNIKDYKLKANNCCLLIDNSKLQIFKQLINWFQFNIRFHLCLQYLIFNMGDLLPTEDENVLDKLTSKNRQLFFLLGRQNDQEKKKRICAQIKATIYEIKQRRPYQRYKDLQTQEIKMRKLLEEIQSLLDRYLSRKKMLQDEREKMRGIKQGYQKMINEVKKSQELQQKIQKINIQIHEGKEITSHLQKGEIVDHYSSLTKTKDMLIQRNKILSEQLKNIKQQIKIFQQEINRDQDRWDELLEEKKRLLMQLYEAQGNRLNYQVLQASTLGKSSTASSKSGELSGYSLRGKKKLIGQSEILLKGEDNKKIYVIWMIILVIWFIWLILLRRSEKQDLDNVCL